MTKLLIVDDNEQNLYMLRVLLESHGYEVVTATNGAEALEKARSDPPDVIISDILMPVMDGFTLCRQWKKDERLKGIPFVFYTATYTDPQDEEFALSLGAERFIVKPVEPDVFVEMLREVIREAEEGRLVAPREPIEEEPVYLKQYSERLVRKLEKKVLDLEGEITECKQAEEALREYQEMFSAFMEQLPAVAFIKDENSRLQYANPYMRDTLGANAWLSKIATEHYPRDLAEQLIANDRKALAEGPLVKEDCVPDKRGDKRYFQTHKFPIRHQDKRPLLGCIAIDITERKRAEEALQESEEKYRLLVENATVTIVVAQDGMLKFFNPKAMEITGYSQEELASRPFTELIHPDDLEVTIGYYLKFLQGEETPPFHTFRIIDKEGSIKWLESNAVLITWEDSPATLNFLSDITERKQAEDALWESEAKYRSLTDDVLDSSAVGVFILDSDFRIVWVNQALERYFSIRSDEIVGKDKRQLIHERIADIFQDPENFAEKVLATYDNNTYIENFECHVLSDGECKERWLEHWSQPIRSGLYAGGRIEHYYDITERKEAEELLREHVRQIERLNDLFVGREQRMIELKKEVNSLLKKLGQPPKYEVPAEVDRLRREFEEKPGQ
jgi:PAS domain S-box-containing protein